MLKALMTVQVARVLREAVDVISLELAEPTGQELPSFSAGSHIDVEVSPGVVRQYSLCNNPLERNRYLIGVLNEPDGRGGSAALHRLQASALLRISEPRNHFQLDGAARRSLLFAGGIGITPLLCMAERLSHMGADFELHYCARSPDRMAFRERIATALYSTHAHLHFDDGPDVQRLDLEQVLGDQPPGTHVYVCGPPGFIQFVIAAADRKGFPPGSLHREYFGVETGEALAEGAPFKLQIASTGELLEVPADKSALEVLRDHGLAVPASCELGVCGTCITRVLNGVPDHMDYILNAKERAAGDQFTPCCSRSKTPLLVLDL